MARLAAAVPQSLAQAMMAGVLLALVVEPVRVLAEAPGVAAPVLLTWFAVSRVNRLFAVPAAVLVALAMTLVMGPGVQLPETPVSIPMVMAPTLTWSAALGIAVPLFIVTMATQNIPGLAILRANGYVPPPGPPLVAVGLASVVSAPFGAPATCLAAVTAALCAGPDAHPDPARRHGAAVWAGVLYALFGLFAGVIVAVAHAAPEGLLQTLTGVALLGVLANALGAALGDPARREAAAITFVVTASGVGFAALGAPVWGLLAGLLVLGADRLRRRTGT